MLQTVTQVLKWISIPALVMASMFSYFAARYETLFAAIVTLGAIVFVERAIRFKQYSWAAALVAIVVVFSPFLLAVKIFLLMGLICIATFTTLLAVFRPQPFPAD